MAAIYQWYVNEEIVFTTPLYPVEEVELLNWGADITGAASLGVPIDFMTTFSGGPLGGDIELVRLDGDAWWDPLTTFASPLGGDLETVRIYGDAWWDPMTTFGSVLGGDLLYAKVEHIQPNDDKIEWGADILGADR